jgi:hypothetical protein
LDQRQPGLTGGGGLHHNATVNSTSSSSSTEQQTQLGLSAVGVFMAPNPAATATECARSAGVACARNPRPNGRPSTLREAKKPGLPPFGRISLRSDDAWDHLTHHDAAKPNASPSTHPPASRRLFHPALVVHVLEISCWNGEVVRVAFAIDTCDREIIAWPATAVGVNAKWYAT